MKNKKIVLVDAMALAYRAYFAFISHPLKNSKGQNTSAVFGFVTQLLKIITDSTPDYIGIVFDSKEKTFRHEIYSEYKSSRAQMPEDMIPQLQMIKDVADAFNIPILIQPGYEADDIIGTVAKSAEKNGMICYAVTPDKDYVQLVSDNIKIVKPGKSSEDILILDKEKVIADFGFEPVLMIDYLALIGDSSDDIPGVSGIGPKTALPLIQKYGTVENIYKNIDEIKESIRQKLIRDQEKAFLSKTLATIKLDVPIDYNYEDLKFSHPNREKVIQLFEEFDFKSLIPKVLSILPKHSEAELLPEKQIQIGFEEFKSESKNYKLVKDYDSAVTLANLLKTKDEIVFDTETDSLDPFQLNLAGVSFCFQEDEAFFVAINPFSEKEELFSFSLEDRLPLQTFKEIFTPIFASSSIKKICQNAKFDISVMHSIGIEVNNFYFDTMLASYLIDPDQKHGMDDLSLKYLNYKPIPLSNLYNVKKEPQKIFNIELEKLKDYSCEDADVTYKLYKVFQKIMSEENLVKLAYEIEFPLVEVLEAMENAGVKIDSYFLISFSKEMTNSLNNLTTKIYEIVGEEFNINSPKQLQEILFNKMNLTPSKSIKTGFSTNAKSLEMLKGQNPIIDLLLEYRQLSKLKSTYAEALPKLVNPKTGRIHTSYNQTIASTGRLSSIEPNLQNIPIRTELGKEIRKAFIPRNSDYVIMSADYSQIELRIMASICHDENLIKAFLNGEDIHRSTAAKVFQVDPSEVTPDMRRKAKEVNFGILYGIGPFGLKTRLGITQTHAKEIIQTYFNTFKNVKKFMDDSIKFAREKGYAQTLLGRKRFLHNINSKNNVLKQFEERVAINMPIQGTAADMIKIAMINIHKKIIEKKLKSKMILQVHDELVFDVHKKEIEEMKILVKELMETALPLDVPVLTEIGIGENWLEAH
jgi:DNA polymerase-1